ncbi:MAG: hypothetical protein H8E40_03450 [Chloroflexi bacterium]|nr:hypothetical protein [Chloroflexota bacterium]MBL7061874.1 hypothetical protein [Dehalococcoidia bacterium]
MRSQLEVGAYLLIGVHFDFNGMQRIVTNTDSIDMPITEKTRVNDALEYVSQQYPAPHLEEDMVVVAVNNRPAVD